MSERECGWGLQPNADGTVDIEGHNLALPDLLLLAEECTKRTAGKIERRDGCLQFITKEDGDAHVALIATRRGAQ